MVGEDSKSLQEPPAEQCKKVGAQILSSGGYNCRQGTAGSSSLTSRTSPHTLMTCGQSLRVPRTACTPCHEHSHTPGHAQVPKWGTQPMLTGWGCKGMLCVCPRFLQTAPT